MLVSGGLRCSQIHPHMGLNIVLNYSLPTFVQKRKAELGISISSIRRFSIPFSGFSGKLGNPP